MTRQLSEASVAFLLDHRQYRCNMASLTIREWLERVEEEVQRTHPDAGNPERNHYDWFMPKHPIEATDAYLDDLEAKLTEALADPFVHDMAQAVLPLIAAYRLLRRVTRDRLMMALHHVDAADFRLGHDLYIPADAILAALDE